MAWGRAFSALALSICALALPAAPALATPPVVTVPVVSNVSYASAHIAATVDPLDANTYWSFQTSTDGVTWTPFSTQGIAEVQPGSSGPQNVEADLTGLKGGTHYFVRLATINFVDSFEGTEEFSPGPNPEFTTLTVASPTVLATADASAVSIVTAKAKGKIQRPINPDPAFDTNCRFEYVTDAQFSVTGFESATQVPCGIEALTTPNEEKEVEAPLTGLVPATEYHLRLTATNAGPDASLEAADTFTTDAATAPVLTLDPAAGVSFTKAHIAGTIDPEGGNVDTSAGPIPIVWELQINREGAGWEFAEGGVISAEEPDGGGPIPALGADPITVAKDLEGLQNGAEYDFRLKAVYAGLEAITPAASFETEAVTPPSVLSVEAANVVYSIAKAEGKIERAANADPAFETNCAFEYITDAQFTANQGASLPPFEGATTVLCNPPNPIITGGESTVEAKLTGLALATTYHLRLNAFNLGGADSKEASTFSTLSSPPAPTVSSLVVSATTGTSAHFSAKVNPNGADPVLNSAWHFQCLPSCGTPGGTVIADDAEHEVAANVSLEPNTEYEVELIATNQGGSDQEGPLAFTTLKLAPGIQAGFAQAVEASSATLTAKVNPRNSTTTYQFEYGLDENYGSLAPAAPADLGEVDNANHEVTQSLEGLKEGATYHFRLVATNTESQEVSHGEDRTFKTGSAACLNEQLRAENNSLSLPDCRAYEMVSPIQKNGNDAGSTAGDPKYALATADGSGILYGTTGAQGTVRRGIQPYSVSRRGPGGWSSESALPAGSLPRIYTTTYAVNSMLPSDDLSSVLFTITGSLGLPNPETGQGSSALYLGHADDTFEWVSQPQVQNPTPPPGSIPGYTSFQPVGASPDLSTVYFSAQPTLLPQDDARAESGLGGWGLYEYTNGVLKSAGTLPPTAGHPEGTESPGGAAPASTESSYGSGPFNPANPDVFSNQVSHDGATLWFVSPDPGPNPTVGPETQLYVRRNGHSTLVSHLPGGASAPSGVVPVQARSAAAGAAFPHIFAYGAPDGKTAIFQSKDALAAGAPNDSSVKAYRYDVATDTVTYLPGVAGTVVASSDDGTRFLFGSESRIAVWDGNFVRTVANLGASNAPLAPARATASGAVFFFSTEAQIPGFNNGGQNNIQIYRYEVAQEQLSCLSCPPDAITPTGSAVLSNTDSQRYVPSGELKGSRGISADGKRVFFDTPDPLVPADTNGVRDVYEWTPSGLSLISSGKSAKDSLFLDNSADGTDVFITTTDGFDPRDTDSSYDVYDARAEGGIAQAPAVTPCSENNTCKKASPPPPNRPGPATNSFSSESEKPRAGKNTLEVVGHPVFDGKLKLKLKLPRPGTVNAFGKGLKAASHTYAKAGSYQLKLALKPAAKKALREKHKLKLKVHLRFSPESGKPSSANVVLTVKG